MNLYSDVHIAIVHPWNDRLTYPAPMYAVQYSTSITRQEFWQHEPINTILLDASTSTLYESNLFYLIFSMVGTYQTLLGDIHGNGASCL